MKVVVLPGDGIGPEVVDASLPVIDALALPWTLEFGDLGWEYWRTEGNPVPERTWDLISSADAALVGAVTSKPAKEARQELDPRFDPEEFRYVSPVIQLRQRLELFANIRPVSDMRDSRFRFVVVRENTEGLYSGIDFRETPPSLWPHVNGHGNAIASGRERTAVSLRLQTETGIRRILEFASGAYFEPVHGSAPSLTGRQRANPMAMILTIAQMARRYGFREEAQAIETAVRRVVIANREQDLTYDLGGRASTAASARAVIGALT
ncbi:isocitrate/isopropylmalate family dehydrogenase [Microbacterium lacticum]